MTKLLSVVEAAEFAKVSKRTIYYHLNKSFKLPRTFSNGRTLVNVNSLIELYPATTAGSKQHISDVQYAPIEKFEKLQVELNDIKLALVKLTQGLDHVV